jgi:hypothetical protein
MLASTVQFSRYGRESRSWCGADAGMPGSSSADLAPTETPGSTRLTGVGLEGIGCPFPQDPTACLADELGTDLPLPEGLY